MFGLQLRWEEWVTTVGVAYLALRVLYGFGRVLWWYATDARRRGPISASLSMLSAAAVAALTVALVSTATPNWPDHYRIPALVGAGFGGMFLGVVFDFMLSFRLYRLSTWLMSFRVPGYREQLVTGDPETRLGAAQRLADLGEYARPARPELSALFRDESADVRAAAVQAVLHSIPDPPTDEDADAPGLARPVLADPDLRVRVYAAAILFHCGAAAAAELLPTLIEGLTSDDAGVTAVVVLSRMGPAAEPAIPALRDAVLSWEKPNHMALDALGKIGAAAVPALVEILERGDPSAKSTAARLLGDLGDDARAALPALQKAAVDTNIVVRAAAKQAVQQLGGER